jgi:Matrixin
LLTLSVSGCFLGYDSRWGQQKHAQQHLAEHETPQELQRPGASGAPREAARTLTLRVYATPGYAATVLDWQKQFGALLDCASSVLAPDFGVTFQAVEQRGFRAKVDEEKLDGVLHELIEEDDAEGVDWVVGLASAAPRFAASADDLGLAPLLGRHFVMRAMSDAHEYEAIQSAFSELPEDERMKLYSARKQHKLCAVFLHELAHTLGVPHEMPTASLMNRRYHVEASGFSEPAAGILRASLASRAQPPHAVLDAELARSLHSLLVAPNADWEPLTRDAELAQISAFETQSPPPNGDAANSPIPAAASAPVTPILARSEPIAGLSGSEQRTYEAARAELRAGHASRARELAALLLSAHPQLAAVQALRCEIAMGIGGDWETISAACPDASPFGH